MSPPVTEDVPMGLGLMALLTLTGANFQGTPVSLPMELVGQAITMVCVLSERRLNRLTNPALSMGLPDFLTGSWHGIVAPAALFDSPECARLSRIALGASLRPLAEDGLIASIGQRGLIEGISQ